jgi:hypothetical protein
MVGELEEFEITMVGDIEFRGDTFQFFFNSGLLHWNRVRPSTGGKNVPREILEH